LKDLQEAGMKEAWIGILGTVGTVLSTISLMPQLVRTWRTRSASDISAVWLIFAMVAMVVWIGYGSLIHAPAVVTVNALCFLQCASIFFIKLHSERVPLTKRT
jgi:MtN3 and saliva related transmembrane protein